jgi:hypothetical protein
MSHYITCPKCGEEELDVDTLRCECGYSSSPQSACSAINIIFDGPPGADAGRFVDVETDDGKSINAGEWRECPDGLWALRITQLPNAQALPQAGRPGNDEN